MDRETEDKIAELHACINCNDDPPEIKTPRAHTHNLSFVQKFAVKLFRLRPWVQREMDHAGSIVALDALTLLVGRKAILRYWNTKRQGCNQMSEDGFEQWWSEHYGE